jgi:hypothetical protein
VNDWYFGWLWLNVHFHSIVIDGVYAAGPDGRPEFHALPAPGDEDVPRLTEIAAWRTRSLLERPGRGTAADPEHADPLSQEDPGMAGAVDDTIGTTVEPITHSCRFALVDRTGGIRTSCGGTSLESIDRITTDAGTLLSE